MLTVRPRPGSRWDDDENIQHRIPNEPRKRKCFNSAAQSREVPYRTTDWTRLGRSCDKLLSLVDGLLTRHISVITINAHIEGDQMRLRQPPLPIPGDFAERLEALHDTLRARDLSTNPSNCEPIRDVFCDLQRDTRMGDGATRNFLCVCGSGRKRKKCCTVLPRTPPSVV